MLFSRHRCCLISFSAGREPAQFQNLSGDIPFIRFCKVLPCIFLLPQKVQFPAQVSAGAGGRRL